MLTYIIVFVLLLLLELLYFRIADKYDIIDKPNERSSHTSVVPLGGGVIFTIAMIVWAVISLIRGSSLAVDDLPFLIGLLMIAGVSFRDDIKPLPDWTRLVVQFVAILLMLLNIYHDVLGDLPMWFLVTWLPLSLVICVGATNIVNFMDGINGMTGGYSLAVFAVLSLINHKLQLETGDFFIDPLFIGCVILALLVFCFFNFRPLGKARCFAGDVGSIGIAFIMLFALGKLVFTTSDASWMGLLLVYGVDGLLTICHRIKLGENLGTAHRKHAYQIMANELKMSSIVVSLIYMALQLVISLVMIYVIPDSPAARWIYILAVFALLAVVYISFMKKYYHLHEEYLASLKK